MGMARWTLIDQQLCRLVDRLCATGYRYTLEAEFRIMDYLGKYYFASFLPEFSEKGIVTVVDTDHGDEVVYSTRIH